MVDDINFPSHYNQGCSMLTRHIVAQLVETPVYDERLDGECVDVIDLHNLPYHVGVAFAYLWRAGLKTPDPTSDLLKASWHLMHYVKRHPQLADQFSSVLYDITQILLSYKNHQ